MSINFIESSDVNGKPIWLNTEHIVSFGVKEMAIKAKHGVGFKDGLWVKCLDCTNSEYEFYIIDETPKSFLEKISNINCLKKKRLELADKLENHNIWRRGLPPYDKPASEPLSPTELGENIDEAIKILRS